MEPPVRDVAGLVVPLLVLVISVVVLLGPAWGIDVPQLQLALAVLSGAVSLGRLLLRGGR